MQLLDINLNWNTVYYRRLKFRSSFRNISAWGRPLHPRVSPEVATCGSRHETWPRQIWWHWGMITFKCGFRQFSCNFLQHPRNCAGAHCRIAGRAIEILPGKIFIASKLLNFQSAAAAVLMLLLFWTLSLDETYLIYSYFCKQMIPDHKLPSRNNQNQKNKKWAKWQDRRAHITAKLDCSWCVQHDPECCGHWLVAGVGDSWLPSPGISAPGPAPDHISGFVKCAIMPSNALYSNCPANNLMATLPAMRPGAPQVQPSTQMRDEKHSIR